MGDHREAHGPLGRFPQRLPHDGHEVHGVYLVGVPPAVGQGPDLRRLQDPPVLRPLLHPALQLRSQPGLQGSDRPCRHHPLPPERRAGDERAGVDDHAVDAAVEHGARHGAGHRLCEGEGRRRHVHPRRIPSARLLQGGRHAGDPRALQRHGHGRPPLHPALRLLRGQGSRGRVPHHQRRLREHRGRHASNPKASLFIAVPSSTAIPTAGATIPRSFTRPSPPGS